MELKHSPQFAGYRLGWCQIGVKKSDLRELRLARRRPRVRLPFGPPVDVGTSPTFFQTSPEACRAAPNAFTRPATHSGDPAARSRSAPKIVQEMLGRSTITQTVDTYSHLLSNMQQQAAERMDALLRLEALAGLAPRTLSSL